MRSLALACSLLAATPAGPQTPLGTPAQTCGGAWCATLSVNATSGRRFCSAESTSFAGQTFRVVLYGDGDAFVAVIDPAWRLGDGIPFLQQLVFDSQTFIIEATAAANAIWWNLHDAGEARALLDRLSRHHELEMNPLGFTARARFALRGSRRAIDEALNCWASLRAQGGWRGTAHTRPANSVKGAAAAGNRAFEGAARLRDVIKRLEAVELAVADDPLARRSAVEAAAEEAVRAKGRSTAGRAGMRGGQGAAGAGLTPRARGTMGSA